MGVHFRPGGAFPFLGLPADELADKHIDLELFGAAGPVKFVSDYPRLLRLCAGFGTPDPRFPRILRFQPWRLSSPSDRSSPAGFICQIQPPGADAVASVFSNTRGAPSP